MRWKLLIAASLLAAAAGSGAFYAAWYFLLAPWGGREAPLWAGGLTLLAPLGAVTYAAVFVYRHTARRRQLQAAATALLASLLTLAALTLVPILAGRPAPEPLPSPPTRNT
ncbi:MAG TPA: hypothetical protein VF591_27590 [Pyrinomonadaceae bacterium]